MYYPSATITPPHLLRASVPSVFAEKYMFFFFVSNFQGARPRSEAVPKAGEARQTFAESGRRAEHIEVVQKHLRG